MFFSDSNKNLTLKFFINTNFKQFTMGFPTRPDKSLTSFQMAQQLVWLELCRNLMSINGSGFVYTDGSPSFSPVPNTTQRTPTTPTTTTPTTPTTTTPTTPTTTTITPTTTTTTKTDQSAESFWSDPKGDCYQTTPMASCTPKFEPGSGITVNLSVGTLSDGSYLANGRCSYFKINFQFHI
jgi:cytoskeletal protein RodZ